MDCISIDFDVNSSSRFPAGARTNRENERNIMHAFGYRKVLSCTDGVETRCRLWCGVYSGEAVVDGGATRRRHDAFSDRRRHVVTDRSPTDRGQQSRRVQ